MPGKNSYLHQVLSGEQGQTDVLHQVSQMLLADVFIVIDPGYYCFKDLDTHRHSLKCGPPRPRAPD